MPRVKMTGRREFQTVEKIRWNEGKHKFEASANTHARAHDARAKFGVSAVERVATPPTESSNTCTHHTSFFSLP